MASRQFVIFSQTACGAIHGSCKLAAYPTHYAMLVQLTLENILSFDTPVTFSMVAGKITKQHTNHVVKRGVVKLLRGAVVYGANAAGKTNLVKAVALFRDMLLQNDCSVCAGFQFRMNDPVKPVMRFAFDFTNGGQLFHYAVSTDSAQVLSENLTVQVGNAPPEELFHRTPESPGLGERLRSVDWYRFRTLKNSGLYLAKVIEDGLGDHRNTIPHADLLLSAWTFLSDIVLVSSRSGLSTSTVSTLFRNDQFKEFLNKLLRNADIGITSIGWKKLSDKETDALFARHWPVSLPLESGADSRWVESTRCVVDGDSYLLLTKTPTARQAEELKLLHGLKSFTFHEESDGTVRLIELAPFFYEILNGSRLCLIDEIDCHLHPFLAKHLLRMFLEHPGTDAQLVVTAHDTNLLTQELWRTDEIWFAEKRPKGSTDLYSVYQFAPRFDKDLEKGYLQGLYGAIPFFGKEPGRG